MANRHDVQARAKGGGVMPPSGPVKQISGAAGDNVIAESRERKFGGAVAGAKAATRMDRPGRKSGGRVGADKSPMSSAARASCAPLKQMH